MAPGPLERLRARDPSRDGLRRALRAGIVIPLAALVSYLVAGPSLTPVFTLVGSIALLIAMPEVATWLPQAMK